MIVGDVMDELAEALKAIPSLSGRSYPHPVGDVVAPAGIIPFPLVGYDATMGRGADELQMMAVVLVPSVHDRATRDRLIGYLSGDGDESVKAALEAYAYTSLDSIRVEQGRVQEYPLAEVDYLAAVFTLDIIGSGTTR